MKWHYKTGFYCNINTNLKIQLLRMPAKGTGDLGLLVAKDQRHIIHVFFWGPQAMIGFMALCLELSRTQVLSSSWSQAWILLMVAVSHFLRGGRGGGGRQRQPHQWTVERGSSITRSRLTVVFVSYHGHDSCLNKMVEKITRIYDPLYIEQ
jgi:hypothetical protein